MTYDSLLIVLTIIAVLSAVFFILAIASDILCPLIASHKPRRQATYRSKA